MLRHARHAVPWTRVLVAGALVVACLELVRWQPFALWALQGIAVGLLAGTAAWIVDEEAAQVLDTLPRGLAWRLTARAPALLVLALTWAVLCRRSEDALFGHAVEILLQGWAALALGTGVAVVARRRGTATPGIPFAGAAVPLSLGWALLRPLHDSGWVFPNGADPDSVWRVSTAGWVLLALLVLGASAAPRSVLPSGSRRAGG